MMDFRDRGIAEEIAESTSENGIHIAKRNSKQNSENRKISLLNFIFGK